MPNRASRHHDMRVSCCAGVSVKELEPVSSTPPATDGEELAARAEIAIKSAARAIHFEAGLRVRFFMSIIGGASELRSNYAELPLPALCDSIESLDGHRVAQGFAVAPPFEFFNGNLGHSAHLAPFCAGDMGTDPDVGQRPEG